MNANATFRSIVSTLALIALPHPAPANTPLQDSFLIPVVASHARDSAGATWSSIVSFFYSGEGEAFVSNEPFISSRRLQAGERGTLEINAAEVKIGPGVIFTGVGFPTPNEIHAQAYVYNDARPDVGVVIPVIRLNADLTTNETIHLLGIPIHTSSRTLVRIYTRPRSAVEATDHDVLVHVFDSSGNPLATEMVHLVSPPLVPLQTNINQPAYAEYRPAVDATQVSSISIDIEPISPAGFGLKIWAFATTTSATSDSVTAVFPAK